MTPGEKVSIKPRLMVMNIDDWELYQAERGNWTALLDDYTLKFIDKVVKELWRDMVNETVGNPPRL